MSKNKANFFRASADDFKKIPGSPVAYWVSGGMRKAFSELPPLSSIAVCKQGIATANNDLFLRRWFEVSIQRISFGIESQESADRIGVKWLPYNKGGEYRKWYGNNEFVINWTEDGNEIRNFVDEKGRPRSAIRNENYFYLPSCTWSDISSSFFGARYSGGGTLFDGSGHSCFPGQTHVGLILTFLCSKLSTMFLRVINPTMHFQVGNVAQIPIENTPDLQEQTKIVFDRVLSVSRTDWDAYETSWDFTENPLVAMRHDIVNLVDSVEKTNSDSFEASLTLRQNQGMRNVSGASEKSEFQIEALYRARDCEEMRRLNPADRTNSDSSEASLTLRQNQGMRNVSGASEKSEFQIEALYKALRERWARDCEEMRRLETENNRIFIEAYGLQDELTPDVPWQEITLTCNPWYRYGVKCNSDSSDCLANARQPQEMRNDSGASEKSEFQKMPRDPTLEERLRSDTVKELVSYAVGCMMGRYSLEKPGLILADQGATVADYWEKLGMGNGELGIRNKELGMGNEELGMGNEAVTIPHSSFHIPHSFAPDEDGIIPILDNDWFEDDIVTRFKAFIKVAFGEDHFFENMAWIEEALGKDIRSYFTKDFYKDHLQRYQNRPIYWLFQSPKGAFRALVYMHRYKPDMVGGVLGYLRSLQTKIDNQLDVAMRVGADEAKSASERVRANKDAVKYAKAKKELDEYERNVLYPLSTERIEIDLDDGVKVNYRKFASALAKVKALEAKGE